MSIRALKESDMEVLREIHKEFYQGQFEFPDFTTHDFLCCFTSTDDEGQIVSAGGVRLITESVILTDKRQSIRKRAEALYDILGASAFVTKKYNYNQLHAFIQEGDWENHLKKVGFTDCKGKPLVLNI